MALLPDVRINWRNLFTGVTNSSFLVDTTGWSVAAGINAAGTSITRVTGDGVLGGVPTNTCAELVTTSTNGSGCKYVVPGTWIAGRPYRFSVWLKRVSGTTAGKITIGSLGTPADRNVSTMTLTTSWQRYICDWAPSADRADVQINVTNNAASALTVRICLADVYEGIDEVGFYGANLVETMDWGRGANFDGSSDGPGSCNFSVRNYDGLFNPDNAGGLLYGLLEPGAEVLVRTVDTSVPLVYGAFSGTLRRIVPRPETRTADLVAEDWFHDWDRAETNIGPSTTTSIRDFRGAILDGLGVEAAQRDLAYGPEQDIGYTGSDRRQALGLLQDLNVAAGSIHFIRPHPSIDVRYQYVTLDRTLLQSWTSAETIDDSITGATGITGLDGYDITDEARVTHQRVSPTIRRRDDERIILWDSDAVPFLMGPTDTVFGVYGVADDPAVDQVLTYTGAPTLALTPYATAGLVTATSGQGLVTSLVVTGRLLRTQEGHSVSAGSGAYEGSEITSDFIPSYTAAKGIAGWIVYRYATAKPRPTLTVTNRTATHTSREVGQVVTLTYGLLNITAQPYYIRWLRTVVDTNALVWTTSLGLERANPALSLFTVGGTAAQGVGGTGILGY